MKKTFYTFLTSLFLLFNLSFLKAQPLTPYSPNFQVNDINGVPHDLYTYLDQGKTVVIEFFTVNSTVSLNSRVAMNDLQATYGTEGDFSMMFLGVEMDTFNGGETQYITDHSITYPIIDDLLPLGELYGVKVNTPMFIMICPDRLWKVRYGSLFDDTSLITNLTDACNGLSDRDLDGKIFEYIGESQFCLGELTASMYIQNYSEENNISSALVNAWEGTELRGSTWWNGYLEPYWIDTVSIDLTGLDTVSDITFTLDSINLQPDTFGMNDTLVWTVEEGPLVGSHMTLSIFTDFTPEQTSWYIEDPMGEIFYEGSGYQANTLNTLDLNVFESGCYRFVIKDSYGDGILNGTTPDGPASGSVTLVSSIGTVIFDENDFESGTTQRFYVDIFLGVDEENGLDFKMHPNPSTGSVQISLNANYPQTTISVFNILGEKIHHDVTEGQNNYSLSTEKWNSGIYLVKIASGNLSKTEKLIVR